MLTRVVKTASCLCSLLLIVRNHLNLRWRTSIILTSVLKQFLSKKLEDIRVSQVGSSWLFQLYQPIQIFTSYTFPFLSFFARHQAKGLKRARDANGEGGKPPKIAKPAPTTVDNSFKGYDLSKLPREAWPQSGENKGAHGYTVKAENGSAI